MANEKGKPKKDTAQTVCRLNPKQRECLAKLMDLEDKNVSDLLKEGLKLLAAKHGMEWPKNRG